MNRFTLYKVLPLGARELGMDDESYRFFLAQCGATLKGDKYSASTMSDAQLNYALDQLKKKGFKLKPKAGFKKDPNWRAPRMAKIKDLWQRLGDSEHKDSVRDASQANLNKFVRTNCGVKRLDWATSLQLNNCVEALKSWCKRCNIDAEPRIY